MPIGALLLAGAAAWFVAGVRSSASATTPEPANWCHFDSSLRPAVATSRRTGPMMLMSGVIGGRCGRPLSSVRSVQGA